MQNSVVVFTFSVLDRNTLYGKFSPKKTQNRQFKLKFGTKTNLNMQNSMVVFNFVVLDQKYPFQFVPKN